MKKNVMIAVILLAVGLATFGTAKYLVDRDWHKPLNEGYANFIGLSRMTLEQWDDRASIGVTTVTDNSSLAAFVALLNGTRKTLTYSVNDDPGAKSYLRIDLDCEPGRMFLYADGDAHYLEIPYEGVWRLDSEAAVAIYAIYTR
jgi:hypothetical protein